jgi:FRG domain-containing protein
MPRAATNVQTTTASSLSEIFERSREIIASWGDPDRQEVWYRGAARSSYGLVPSLYRPANAGLDEDDLLSRFVSLGSPFMNERPASDWEWYFVAQHYGLPTRLLDWSENILAATYFALAEDMEKSEVTYSAIRTGLDRERKRPRTRRGKAGGGRGAFGPGAPAVWMIDAGWLNSQAGGADDDRPIFPAGEYSDHWLPRRVARGRPDEFNYQGRNYRNTAPLAILPLRSTPRIVAQQGVFTVHGADESPLEVQFAKARRPMIARIVLDATRKHSMWWDLIQSGVTRLSIFPELDSAANLLKRSQQ